ncbi:MAG: hypothetical protein ABI318_23870 [Chthoniobacteraceae bacterium]
MAESARRVFSLRGLLAETITAVEIKSRADARKRGPFLGDDNELLLWAKGVWRDSRRLRSPCFKHYPSTSSGGGRGVLEIVRAELEQRVSQVSESQLHKKAKIALAEYLRGMLLRKERLLWCYKDAEASDFALAGDLLSEVTDVVVEEYTITLPFGGTYRPDIVLLGSRVKEKPILLGLIELELSHEAELLKCLLCKSTGAPLFLIDLHETEIEAINDDWCHQCVTQTTANSEDGRRNKNFIFLHNMLYPIFTEAPRHLLNEEKHQFLIFVRDEEFEKLRKLVATLKEALGLTDSDVSIGPVRLNPAVQTSVSTFENEGSIAGKNWRDYNDHQYLRLVIMRPMMRQGPLYKFHLVLANLLTLYFDALVGYKFRRRDYNNDPDNPIWIGRTWDKSTATWTEYKMLPKCVSEPVRKIVEIVRSARKAAI